MELDELTVDRPSLDLGDADWEEHLRLTQSTEIAEGVYFSVGFRDLGRYLEYVRATE